jgi:hypothetical protein
VVAADRLLVWHDGRWSSVWYAGITNVRFDPTNWTLDLFFEADPPYRLSGPAAPALNVVLRHLAFRDVAGVAL